jgi:hypothetical protein
MQTCRQRGLRIFTAARVAIVAQRRKTAMTVHLDDQGRAQEIRWSAKRKARRVLQHLGGAPVDVVAAEADVKVAELVGWVDQFIAAGTNGLKGSQSRRGE